MEYSLGFCNQFKHSLFLFELLQIGYFSILYSRIELKDGALKKLLEEFEGKSPIERGKLLSEASENSEALKIITAHQELAMEGQTEVKRYVVSIINCITSIT